LVKAAADDTPSTQDPLRMFGILVPQSLRTAQAQFSAPLPAAVRLVGVIQQLDTLGREIEQARIAV